MQVGERLVEHQFHDAQRSHLDDTEEDEIELLALLFG